MLDVAEVDLDKSVSVSVSAVSAVSAMSTVSARCAYLYFGFLYIITM